MEFDETIGTGVTFDLTGPDATARRVREAAAKRRRFERLTEQLEEVVAQIEAAEAEVNERREALVKEQRDVEQFHHFSFSKLRDEIEGNIEDRLRQEIAEANAAHYAVSEAEHRRHEATLAMARINDQLADLGDARAEWVAALAAREAEMREKGDPAVPRLTEIEGRWGEIEDERSAVTQAIASAEVVIERLDEAAELLATSDRWGLLDTLFDGGVITSSPHQDRMDEAATLLQAANDASETLRRDLRGLVAIGSEDADLAALHQACEAWFGVGGEGDGGLLGAVRSSLEDVRAGRDTIARVINQLREHDTGLEAEWIELRDERRTLLAPASPPQAI